MSTRDVVVESGRTGAASAEWLRGARRAKLLAWASLGWMTIEGVVAVVAVSFWLLAPYVAIEAVHKLAAGDEPGVSWLGIGLTIASVILMPLFGVAKLRLGARLGSAATAGEGTQNILCAYLGAAVLLGLGANAAFGWWWADPVAAVFIAAVAVREGLQSWRGEECS